MYKLQEVAIPPVLNPYPQGKICGHIGLVKNCAYTHHLDSLARCPVQLVQPCQGHSQHLARPTLETAGGLYSSKQPAMAKEILVANGQPQLVLQLFLGDIWGLQA